MAQAVRIKLLSLDVFSIGPMSKDNAQEQNPSHRVKRNLMSSLPSLGEYSHVVDGPPSPNPMIWMTLPLFSCIDHPQATPLCRTRSPLRKLTNCLSSRLMSPWMSLAWIEDLFKACIAADSTRCTQPHRLDSFLSIQLHPSFHPFILNHPPFISYSLCILSTGQRTW